MKQCIARTRDYERCKNRTEPWSLFCRRHRWWWLITLFGAVVAITGLASNIATILGFFDIEVGASKCPPRIGQTFHATVGAKVWSQPNVFQGVKIKVFQEKAEVFILDGPVTGPIRDNDSSILGNWWKISLGKGQEGIGWMWGGRFDECQP